MRYKLKYSAFNNRSILIDWPQKIDQNILNDILIFKNSITSNYIKQKVEVINTYCSILIIYNFTIDNFNDEFYRLKQLYRHCDPTIKLKIKLWEIPVCYDELFGTDLSEFSAKKGLSKTEIINKHSDQIYIVFFTGFLPGFLYLGGLDPKLKMERKNTPSLDVKKGSVAIGGNQTGIYPQDSPGGWHVIGNTPIDLFNPKQDPPCQILAGDKLKFYEIDKAEHYNMKKEVISGTFNLTFHPSNA